MRTTGGRWRGLQPLGCSPSPLLQGVASASSALASSALAPPAQGPPWSGLPHPTAHSPRHHPCLLRGGWGGHPGTEPSC